jgi:hypothetical protein
VDERPRFRPPDKRLIQAWDKATKAVDTAAIASPEDQRQAMQDAMRSSFPNVWIAVDDKGWIVYREGLPKPPELPSRHR